MNTRLSKMQHIIREDKFKSLVISGLESNPKLESIVEQVNSTPTSEKLKNVFKFISSFSNIKEAAEKLLELAKNLKGNGEPVVTAQMSKQMGKLGSILWLITFFLAFGAAGTSDMNSKDIAHANLNHEVIAIASTVAFLGAATIVSFLSWCMREKENKTNRRV